MTDVSGLTLHQKSLSLIRQSHLYSLVLELFLCYSKQLHADGCCRMRKLKQLIAELASQSSTKYSSSNIKELFSMKPRASCDIVNAESSALVRSSTG